MAKEIQESGLTIGGVDYYARVWNAAGQIWNNSGAAYEAYNASNIALYGADAGSGTPYQDGTEDGSTGRFTFDTAATSPRYYEIFEQAGAAPVEGDQIVAAGTFDSADIAAIKTDTGNLVTRITSTLFTGITSLAEWIGLIAGKQVGNSTARTELRATGAGSGTYDETTRSLEALGDELAEHDTGAGDGARTILVTVTDGSDPLENATVRLTEGATTNVAKTNASGERSFGLDDATWNYAVTKPGYTGVTGTHVVNSSATPLNIELTLNTVTPPDAPELCRVSLDLYKNGVAVSGATFEAKFVDINQAIENIVLSKQIDTDTTDANGHADLDLIQLDQFISSDGLYQIRVIHPDKTVSLDIKTTIPNQSNVNVQDLIT